MRDRTRWARRIAPVVVTLATAGSAAAAYVCHPDPPGTRTLAVRGDIATYKMTGNRVSVFYRGSKGCRTLRWNIARGTASLDAAFNGCADIQSPSTATRGVTLEGGSADAPDRLKVRTGGRIVGDWPLPIRAWSLDVDGGTALVSTLSSREVYAIQLATGRAAIVGLNRHRDPAQIERPGIVFQDNLYKRNENKATRLLKFIPRRFVDRALTRVGRPLTVKGRIADMAMDGSRVALAMDEFEGECDAVIFWNVTWRYTSRITEDEETTCRLSRRGADIKAISIGGLRAAWTMKVGNVERVLTASSVDCFERLIASAQRITALSGDEKVLAFSLGQRNRGVVGGIDEQMHGSTLLQATAPPAGLAADAGRFALLFPSGELELRAANGSILQRFGSVAGARAVSLRADRLVVLARDSLEVFDAATGRHVRTWPAPRQASGTLDVHFGVAVIPAGRQVLAVSLETGSRIALASAPASVDAEIEAPGVTYAYNVGDRTVVKFIPFARVEAALR